MKIKVENRNIWFSSDFHYWHKNIVLGESVWHNRETNCRRFNTVQEMSRHLVQQFNSYVSKDDILFFLGDWSFGGIQNIWNLRKQLNVKEIHFLFGNHDHHIINNKVLPNCHYRDVDSVLKSEELGTAFFDGPDETHPVKAQDLFTSVHHYLEVEIDKINVCLMHYPIEEWNDRHQKTFHLHGHSHGNIEKRTNRLDVGIDNIYDLFGEYRPINWLEVKKYFKK